MLWGVVPNKEVGYIAYVAWASTLTVPMLFPFVGFMVLDFGKAPTIDEAGYYSGILAGSFMIGRMLGSTPWGYISDKWGPILVLRLSTVVSGLLTIYFGLTPNYWTAVAVRVLTGFFNPVIAVSKALLPKMVPEDQQHRAMSLIAIQWGLGLICGPMIGGFLSDVMMKSTHPYFLPCLVCGVLQLTALVPLYLVRIPDLNAASDSKEYAELPDSKTPRADNHSELEGAVVDDASETVQLTVTNPAAEPDSTIMQDDTQMEERTAVGSVMRCDSDAVTEEPQADPPVKEQAWYRNSDYQIMLLFYCCISLFSISTDEIISLWTIADISSGGLGAGPNFVGTALAVTGCVSLTFQIAVGPRLVAAWNYKGAATRGLLLVAASTATIPFINLLREYGGWCPMAGLVLASCSKQIGFYFAFTCSFVMLNNSVPKSHLGRANGVGMMLSSVFKFAGPAGFSPLFAWSLRPGHSFPFDSHLYFMLASAVLVCVATCVVPCIPGRLEQKREAPSPK